MNIIPCTSEHLNELFEFVKRLNSDASHHIGYFGVGENSVREAFNESNIPTEQGFQLAYENGILVGALGVDADDEIHRVWILGPFVNHENWQQIADDLYTASQPAIPRGNYEWELFCDAENKNVHKFAARHEFLLRSEAMIMTLAKNNYRRAAQKQTKIINFEESYFEQFQTMHNLIFPNTYMTANQIIQKQNERYRLMMAVENQKLLGYLFGKVEEESGFIDFLAVDESARRLGIGADLLTNALDWMFDHPSTQNINLTMNTNNPSALGLYTKFGFTTERVTHGYRKIIHV